ncbi:MAG: type II toxin-antitoxin system VapB family antitoxin [Methylococcaceae bacterium]|nr:type II toxin-antitoxin system VapB family antitoxin [Methylococcaceae bacterium]
MITTRVFKSGNSQAVRIPKEFQFDVDELEIFQRGEEIILRKKQDNLADVMDLFAALPDDFMESGRDDPPPQERNFDL